MAKQLNILQYLDGHVKEILTTSEETKMSFHKMLFSFDEDRASASQPGWGGAAGLAASRS